MEQAGSTAEGNLPCPKIVRGQKDLTQEQAAYTDQFTQERIAAMLSTAPIDEREAEQHLQAAYRAAGLKPVPVRWFDSPADFVHALFANKKIRGKKRVADNAKNYYTESDVGEDMQDRVRHSVRHSLRDDVLDLVGDSVRDDVRHSVRDSVGNSVRDSVRDITQVYVWEDNDVWDRVAYIVEYIAGDSVQNYFDRGWHDSVWRRVEHITEYSVQAHFDADWLSVSRFFHEVFEENKLIHLALLNEMVCGYRLGNKQAWLVHKPIRLERDEQGRLHSTDGMCIHYRDGWGFYAWHGTRCSEKLILHPEQITREEWMNERNLEIRRLMQERIGNERFVEMLGGRCIDQGRRADLIEVKLRDDPEKVARFVRVKDTSTERVYYLRVPPTFDKADEALAWTFGLEEQDYQPTQEV